MSENVCMYFLLLFVGPMFYGSAENGPGDVHIRQIRVGVKQGLSRVPNLATSMVEGFALPSG